MTNNSIKVKTLDIDGYKMIYIDTKPPRLEAKVEFNRDHISQKLIFTLMEISHQHGFACSPPDFDGPDNPRMSFLIGTLLPSSWSMRKYARRLYKCIIAISKFTNDFSNQLDFTKLDISMFGGIDLRVFRPDQLAAIRDQHYNGSWDKYMTSMAEQGRVEEVDIIGRCITFEEKNQKDIGYVGHRLSYILQLLEFAPTMSTEIN